MGVKPWGQLIAFTLFVACHPPSQPTAPSVSLRVHGAPADAVVAVDEKLLGTFEFVAARGVALPPGLHQITVRAAGYFPWDREVEARKGARPIVLDVSLIPIPN